MLNKYGRLGDNMKNIKKVLLLIMILIIVITVLGVIIISMQLDKKFQIKPIIDSNMSEVQTINKFFEFCNEKNPRGANELLINDMFNSRSCITIKSVDVNNLKLINKDKIDINQTELKNGYDYSCVEAYYKMDFLFGIIPDEMYGLSSNYMLFYLIKETEDSDWKIFSWGHP